MSTPVKKIAWWLLVALPIFGVGCVQNAQLPKQATHNDVPAVAVTKPQKPVGDTIIPATALFAGSDYGFHWIDDASATLQIAWSKPEQFDPANTFQNVIPQTLEFAGDRAAFLKDLQCSPNLWKRGVVSGGAYDGWTLYYWERTEGCNNTGPFTYTNPILLAPDQKQARILIRSVFAAYKQDREFLIPAPRLTIAHTLPPSVLTLPNGKHITFWLPEDYRSEARPPAFLPVVPGLADDTELSYSSPDCWDMGCVRDPQAAGSTGGFTKIAVTKEGYSVFVGSKTYTAYDASTCLFVITQDGRAYRYWSLIPFTYFPNGLRDLEITWSSPLQMYKNYDTATSACTNDCPEIYPLTVKASALKRLGQTSSGEPLYAIPGSGPDKSSDGPDAFLWQDGLDRWVKYTRFADECQGMGD